MCLLSRINRSSKGVDILKRLVDVVFSLTGLVVLVPILLLIALLIKLDSRGPVFYRGVRVGRFGKPFRIYKFRTMVVNAEKLGTLTTAKDDPRIIRGGKFLRKYRFDELPQLINVLEGDMSLVGPRPEVEEYLELDSEEAKIILSMRPGMTDYASVRFLNLREIVGNENAEQKFLENVRPIKTQLRVEYVKNHSLGGDFKIIIQSLIGILKQKK